MFIEFLEGSAVVHPNFERYMEESAADGSVPVRFDCEASSNLSAEDIAELAADHLERREKEEEADILPSTVVATLADGSFGRRRFRVIAIARHRKPVVNTVVVREPFDVSSQLTTLDGRSF